MIKRIAMWRLHDRKDAGEMRVKLLSMLGEVTSLEAIEVGINESNSAAAFDIVFVGSFASWAALRDFEADPFHKEVGRWVSGAGQVRHVVDYEV